MFAPSLDRFRFVLPPGRPCRSRKSWHMRNSRVVDLSVSIDPAHWEPEPVTRVEIAHRAGADLLGKSYVHFTPLPWWRRLALRVARRGKYFIDHRDFPDGLGLSLMFYRLTTHTGTHIDAPYHYGWREV